MLKLVFAAALVCAAWPAAAQPRTPDPGPAAPGDAAPPDPCQPVTASADPDDKSGYQFPMPADPHATLPQSDYEWLPEGGAAAKPVVDRTPPNTPAPPARSRPTHRC